MSKKVSILPVLAYAVVYLFVLLGLIVLSFFHGKTLFVILLPSGVAILPAVIYHFMEIKNAVTLKDGFRIGGVTKKFLKGIVSGFIGILAFVFLQLFIGKFFISIVFNYYLMDYIRSQNPVFVFGLFCILIPVFEELLFRKMLLERLVKQGGMFFAILFSSLLFALFNLIFPVYIAFFLGVFYSLLYLFHKKILINITIHSACNTMLILAVLGTIRVSQDFALISSVFAAVLFIVFNSKGKREHFVIKKVEKGRECLIILLSVGAFVLLYKYLVNQIFLFPFDLFVPIFILYAGLTIVSVIFLKFRAKFLLIPLAFAVFIACFVFMKDKIVIESMLNSKNSCDSFQAFGNKMVSLTIQDSDFITKRSDFYDIRDDLTFDHIGSFNGNGYITGYEEGKISIRSYLFKYEMATETGNISYLGRAKSRYPRIEERTNHTYYYNKDHAIIDKGKPNEVRINHKKKGGGISAPSKSGDHFVYMTKNKEYIFYRYDMTEIARYRNLYTFLLKKEKFWRFHDKKNNAIIILNIEGKTMHIEKLPYKMKPIWEIFPLVVKAEKFKDMVYAGSSGKNLFIKSRGRWFSLLMKSNASPFINVENNHIFIDQRHRFVYTYIFDPETGRLLTRFGNSLSGPIDTIRKNGKEYYVGKCFFSPKQIVLFSIK